MIRFLSTRLMPAALAASLAVVVACERTPAEGGAAAKAGASSPAPTNRIDIGPAVRRNLGITFAKVEERPVARTMRVPGRFELLPTAKREYRAPVPGQIELFVKQYQPIDAATILYAIDSPRWRELQRDLADAQAQMALAQASVDSIGPFMEAHEAHHREVQNAVDLWSKRVAKLEELEAAGGASGEEVAAAKASLASARTDLAETLEKEAELEARTRDSEAQLRAATARRAILLKGASSLTGLGEAELTRLDDGRPRWQSIERIQVPALAPGIVESLPVTNGAFVDEHARIVDTVQPDEVRFRATALQGDLGRLAQGQRATVVAPQGGASAASPSSASSETIAGSLSIAPTADPERRTIELLLAPDAGASLPSWARAGISGFLEVVTEGTEKPELAIPLASVVRDGAQRLVFRRDPANPDKAIRMDADLGVDDGRWIVIKSGVREGDEVVLDGVYQLMLAMSGSAPKGGHFHADGTFHEDEH
ncbi:MAG: HlyD family efflux transporter periplasmic adaptor subunit [Phycisphaerae bacterium]|nr:HlyD family efflux transporter periplasmic adaptor subunit [Phycisphaerae bacterium]